MTDSAREHLATIVDSSDDAILTKALDGTVQSWNRAAERMYGYSAAEMIGRSIETLEPSERHGEVSDILRRIRVGERIEHFETERIAKNGRRLRVSLTISPLHDAAGAIVGASTIARDITEQVQLREALQLANSELRRSNAELDAFASGLAHDLAGPLAVAAGYIGIALDRAELDPTLRDWLEHADGGVRRAAQLSKDLLTYARVGGALTIESLDVVTVVDEARADVGTDGVRVGDLPVVRADRSQLRLVLRNLIANAARYGGRDCVIDVHGVETEHQWIIYVDDDGPGVPESDRERIFGMLDRGSRARDDAGSGIGLAICRRIVERHGGTIRAASSPSGGARFTIALTR